MPLQNLNEGETIFVPGLNPTPYRIRKIGGVVDCSCPAWCGALGSIDTRTCEHIKANINQLCLSTAQGGFSKAKIDPLVRSRKDVPSFLLAQTWTKDWDPTGWWMSKRLTGIRVLYNGMNLITSEGDFLYAPNFFQKSLPSNIHLDGVLVGLSSRESKEHLHNNQRWETLRFIVSDVPRLHRDFETCQEYLRTLQNGRPGRYWSVLPQERCHGSQHLLCYLEDIGRDAGVMLRRFGSQYKPGHSGVLLEVHPQDHVNLQDRVNDQQVHRPTHRPTGIGVKILGPFAGAGGRR